MRICFLAVLLVSCTPRQHEPFAEQVSSGSPLVEYRFEEGTGLVVSNSGGASGADGTRREGLATGGPVFSSDTPGAFSTASLFFDGVNDWVSVPNDFSYGGVDRLTIEAWVKPSDIAGQNVIWDDYGNPGTLFTIWDGVVQFNVSTTQHPGMGISIYAGAVETGLWQHVAGVYSGSDLRLYVDGVDTCVRVQTSGSLQENAHATIGIGADNETVPALNFAGGIDELRVSTEALDVDAIAGGIFAGTPDPCASPTPTPTATLTPTPEPTPTPCVATRLPNPDGDDNPRLWADQNCPAEHVLVGVRYGSMGSYGPDFVDAIAPICVPADDPFAPHVLVPNSEMGYPGEVTVTCPSGETARGIGYSELMGPAPNPDQIDGVTVICEDGAAPNPDIGSPSIVLTCDRDVVGLSYKDKPDPYSDFAESVTPLCGCDCRHGNGHHHGKGQGHSSHGNGHGYGHDCN